MSKVLFICALMTGLASAVYAVDGFGQNTTGGAGGTTVTVTDAASFKSYVETIDTPYIVQVSGTINLSSAGGYVDIRSNKTIRGIGTGPTIIGELGFKNGSSNVIVERLTITNPSDWGEGDGLSIKEDILNVFVTQCTFYDCVDGLLDITRRSDWITVSWCKFYFTGPGDSNNRVSLIGNSDSATDDYGTLHITFHHNWYSTNSWQRIPSVRFGKVHLYNNYYTCTGNLYGIWSRIKAECLIENNYFKQVNDPYSIHVEDEGPSDYGKISASGNIIDDCTGVVDDGSDTVFTPTYTYSLDETSLVPLLVQYGAGADGQEGFPPHWLFGMYGDFDLSGLVDIMDLSDFAGYWLAAEDIQNADYYANGIVDMNEWALFASNWRKIPEDTTPPAAPANLSAAVGDSTVNLNWDDNAESDLDGYNVYRSATPGTGYIKLNSSLLENSAYPDNTVTNNSVYFYIVKAVDTSSNESASSAEVSAVPIDPNTIIIQENAAGFCGLDGIVDTAEHAGYTGYGYCDTTNAVGSGINWKINITSAGTYTFTWRFANGSTDRPARLLINSVEEVTAFSFPATGSWENWTTVSVQVTLSAGTKDIRLEATTSGGCANIDYLMVSGAAPEIAVCE